MRILTHAALCIESYFGNATGVILIRNTMKGNVMEYTRHSNNSMAGYLLD